MLKKKYILLSLLAVCTLAPLLAMDAPAAQEPHTEIIHAEPLKEVGIPSLKEKVAAKIIAMLNANSGCSTHMLIKQLNIIKGLPLDIKEFIKNYIEKNHRELLESANACKGVPLVKDLVTTGRHYDQFFVLDDTELCALRRSPRSWMRSPNHTELILVNAITNNVELPIKVPLTASDCLHLPNQRYLLVQCRRLWQEIPCEVLIVDRVTRNSRTIWKAQAPGDMPMAHIIGNNLIITSYFNGSQSLAMDEHFYALANNIVAPNFQPYNHVVPAHNRQPGSVTAFSSGVGAELDFVKNGQARHITIPLPFDMNRIIHADWIATGNREWIFAKTFFVTTIISAQENKSILVHADTGNYVYVSNVFTHNFQNFLTQNACLGFQVHDGTLVCHDFLHHSIDKENSFLSQSFIPQIINEDDVHFFGIHKGILKKYTSHYALLANTPVEDLLALLIAYRQYVNGDTINPIILDQLQHSTNEYIRELAKTRLKLFNGYDE